MSAEQTIMERILNLKESMDYDPITGTDYNKPINPCALNRKIYAILYILEKMIKARSWKEETFTLFKFCQNCHTVLTFDVEQCPVCKNPRVRGSCSQVWLRSRGLVDV